MNDKKKKFVIPEAEIIDFSEEDIITGSGLTPGEDTDDWWTTGGDENWQEETV